MHILKTNVRKWLLMLFPQLHVFLLSEHVSRHFLQKTVYVFISPVITISLLPKQISHISLITVQKNITLSFVIGPSTAMGYNE